MFGLFGINANIKSFGIGFRCGKIKLKYKLVNLFYLEKLSLKEFTRCGIVHKGRGVWLFNILEFQGAMRPSF